MGGRLKCEKSFTKNRNWKKYITNRCSCSLLLFAPCWRAVHLPAAEECNKDDKITYFIRPSYWHYGWRSHKHMRFMQHSVRLYAFVDCKEFPGMAKCVTRTTSSHFTIHSYKGKQIADGNIIKSKKKGLIALRVKDFMKKDYKKTSPIIKNILYKNHITILGGARGVSGSCYLIETNEENILVDCGLFYPESKELDYVSDVKITNELNTELPISPHKVSSILIISSTYHLQLELRRDRTTISGKIIFRYSYHN